MLKNLLIHTFLIFLSLSGVLGQTTVRKSSSVPAAVTRIKSLQALSKQYNSRRRENSTDQEKAIKYARLAIGLSERSHELSLKTESLCLIAEAYLKSRNKPEGKAWFLKAVDNCRSLRDSKAEAATWLRMGVKMSYFQFLDTETLVYEQNALDIYLKINDQNGLVDALQSKGAIFEKTGKLDSAKTVLFESLAIAERINRKDRFLLYRSLGKYYNLTGGVARALNFFQLALQNLKALHTPLTSVNYGQICTSISILIYDDRKESYKYLYQAIDYLRQSDEELSGYYLVDAYECLAIWLVNDKKPEQAMTEIATQLKKYPPVSDMERGKAASCLGICYKALKKFDISENYYVQAIKYFYRYPLLQETAKGALMRFYSETKQFSKLQNGVERKLIPRMDVITYANQVYTEYQLFQLDSTNGNYRSALEHFIKFQKLRDSIDKSTKTKQLHELQIKYQSNEKEHDIRLLKAEAQKARLQRNIKNTELKEVNLQRSVQQVELQKVNLQNRIEAAKLKNVIFQQDIQRANLKRSALEKKMTLGGIVMLLIILTLSYAAYRSKSRSNVLLVEQKKEINQQNRNLGVLLNEKDNLLKEKDWLLKEVHHRVKNNLHMISSLLESQSAYLENEALLAVQKSQHRVQAISILHQKLYLTDHATTVAAGDYLREIISYLNDTFANDRKVRFELELENIPLDVSQAVPIGLIVNEAVTNVLKYAFSDKSDGIVSIKFRINEDNQCVLNISDNGKGLPGDFDLNKNSTLGLTLIKGLAKNIGAKFVLHSLSGTHITIIYDYSNVSQIA